MAWNAAMEPETWRFPAGTDSTWRHPDHFRKVRVKGRVPLPRLCAESVEQVDAVLGLAHKTSMLLALGLWINNGSR